MVRRADALLREKTPALWIRGEISGWKKAASGYCYFTLKDSQAELCCVLPPHAARGLPALPANGMEVDAFGQLGVYPKRGQFQLEVGRIESTGAGGLWELARQRLLRQLRSEGLLDEDRKRPIPALADCVGIVTSAESAAFHDMWRALRRRAWWVRTLVSPCMVEGAAAAPGIAAAIRRFGQRREECPVDVVIVARGGGSMESLWGYNMECVARAIAECPVPVISAVGHETDYTVADSVADVRSATPTAGAERAVPDGRQLLAAMDEYPRETRRRMQRHLDRQAERLRHGRDGVDRAMGRRLALLSAGVDAAGRHLGARSPERLLARVEAQTQRATDALHEAMERRLSRLERDARALQEEVHDAAERRLERLGWELAGAAEALEARSPLRVLARGYSVVSDRTTGRVVRSPAEVRPEQRLRVRLAEGEIAVRVEEPAEDAPASPPVSS